MLSRPSSVNRLKIQGFADMAKAEATHIFPHISDKKDPIFFNQLESKRRLENDA
jgi:hypothetical protein